MDNHQKGTALRLYQFDLNCASQFRLTCTVVDDVSVVQLNLAFVAISELRASSIRTNSAVVAYLCLPE
jgi:hypothetical protein